MDNKFIKFSGVFLLVLIILAVFPWIMSKINNYQSKKINNVSVNMSEFTKETVNKIVIKKGNDEKTLYYKDKQWFIGENEADENKINELFQDFSEMKIKEMVSNNEENWKKFETTKDTGFQLIVTQNGKEHIFFLGKIGPTNNDFYIRKEGIKNVYLVQGELRDKLLWEKEKWKKTAEDKK